MHKTQTNPNPANPIPVWALLAALMVLALVVTASTQIDILAPLILRLALMLPRGILVPLW